MEFNFNNFSEETTSNIYSMWDEKNSFGLNNKIEEFLKKEEAEFLKKNDDGISLNNVFVLIERNSIAKKIAKYRTSMK